MAAVEADAAPAAAADIDPAAGESPPRSEEPPLRRAAPRSSLLALAGSPHLGWGSFVVSDICLRFLFRWDFEISDICLRFRTVS
jgi:hypothetical protein